MKSPPPPPPKNGLPLLVPYPPSRSIEKKLNEIIHCNDTPAWASALISCKFEDINNVR